MKIMMIFMNPIMNLPMSDVAAAGAVGRTHGHTFLNVAQAKYPSGNYSDFVIMIERDPG